MANFQVGEVVVSTTNEQHLVAGISYTVRSTRERRLPWGVFVEYGVTCCDRTIGSADVLWVRNGHVVLRSRPSAVAS